MSDDSFYIGVDMGSNADIPCHTLVFRHGDVHHILASKSGTSVMNLGDELKKIGYEIRKKECTQ